MRLLSLNVWGGQLLDPLLAFLQNCQADILCLQEVFDSSTSITADMFGVILDARLDLFNLLQHALPHHRGFFFPSCEKNPHDIELAHLAVPYGIATFVRSDIPVIEHRTGFVHRGFEVVSRGEPPLPRIAHAFKIYDRTTKQTIVIAHMHGLWTPEGKGDIAAREVQAINFRDLLTGLATGGKIIACGDWNILPSSCTFAMLNTLVPIELVTNEGHTSTRTSHYTKVPRYADYMCVSPEVYADMDRFEVVRNPEVSDHCPLVLDFN